MLDSTIPEIAKVILRLFGARSLYTLIGGIDFAPALVGFDGAAHPPHMDQGRLSLLEAASLAPTPVGQWSACLPPAYSMRKPGDRMRDRIAHYVKILCYAV